MTTRTWVSTSVRRISATTAAACAVAALAAGCGGSSEPTARVEAGPPKAVSQQEWDAVVQAAKEEGGVIVYSSHSGTEATFAEFEKAYPGIDVTVERAPTNDLIARLDQEIDVNAPGADVAFHAQSIWFDEHDDAGDLAAIKLSPQAVADGWEKRVGGKGYADVYSYPYLIGYNSATAKPVASVEELVNNAGDATIGILGAGAATSVAFQYDLWLQAYGPDFLQKLSKLDVRVDNSSTPLSQGLAAGELDYVIGMVPGKLGPLKAEGAPVDEVVPAEDAGPVYGLTALAGARHPNAAQVFVNWLISPEGQALLIKNHSPGSVPLDIEGSIPWGEITTYKDADWPKSRWDAWLSEQWNPYFG